MMRKALCFFVLCLPFGEAVADSWTDLGLNFRQTGAYVTDNANQTYVQCTASGSGTDAYPTVRGGATFGYTDDNGSADCGRDRSTGVDKRFAGMHFFTNAANPAKFRVLLSSASQTYDVRVALGETSNASAYQCFTILDSDNTTALATAITDSDGTSAANYDDATGVNRTEAAWPGSNVAVRVTYSGDSAYFQIGCSSSQTGDSRLAHIQMVAVSTSKPFSVLNAMGEL